MSLQVGQIIENKYRIVRVLGQGGMGAVYEGENTRIHRRVAIKVLHAEVATKADIVQRFEREAQAAGRIGSEHIVEVLDLGNLPSGERFMVMEFLDGEPLSDRIKRQGKLSAYESGEILKQLLSGLGAAHEAGIIHRDLKPDNVFLIRSKSGPRGQPMEVPSFVKLVDFGVSKFSALDDSFSMTRTGAVMGTPYYMSPEQARGQKIDHRSDLYSVGVVGYQMLTGRVPFNADTFNELLFKIALESPEPAELYAPGLDPYFAQIIMRGMAREPAQRFQTAAEFTYAIDQWMAANPGARPAIGMPGGTPHGGVRPYTGSAPVLGQSGTGPHAWPGGMGPQAGQTGPHRPVQVGPAQAFNMTPNGMHPMGGSHPGPGAPGASAALGQSQVALTVTKGEAKRSGALIAVALVAVIGAGGGFAAYKVLGAKHATEAGPSKSDTSAPADAPSTKPVADKPASATASTAKEDTPPAKSAAPEASSESLPAESATAQGPIAQAPRPPVGPGPTRPPVVPPTKPPPTAQPGGRQIGGGLY